MKLLHAGDRHREGALQAGADSHPCQRGRAHFRPELSHRPQALRGKLAGPYTGWAHCKRAVCRGLVPHDQGDIHLSCPTEFTGVTQPGMPGRHLTTAPTLNRLLQMLQGIALYLRLCPLRFFLVSGTST